MIKGQKIYDYIKGLDSYYKADFMSQEEYKLESLKKLLTHCQRNVPYYTGLFKRIDSNITRLTPSYLEGSKIQSADP